MVDLVPLGPAETASLIQSRRLAAIRDQAAQRLATGLKVSGVTDNPGDYFQAKALTERVAALGESKADIGQGIEALLATQAGTRALESLGDQLKGIALAAQSADATEKAALAQQFDTVRQQLDNLAGDVSYQGVNLLSGSGTLSVSLGEKSGDRLDVAGAASDSSSLGVGDAASFNNFASLTDVDNAVAAVDGALATLRTTEARIVGNASLLRVREDFAGDLANTLQAGADKIVLADVNAEGARLLAANVREGLTGSAQRIAARSAAHVLELVKGG